MYNRISIIKFTGGYYGKKNLISGTPWHVGTISLKEDDDRRHQSRCIRFDKKTKLCSYYFTECHGSSHCIKYQEYKNIENDFNEEKSIRKESSLKKQKINSAKEVKIKNNNEIKNINEIQYINIEKVVVLNSSYKNDVSDDVLSKVKKYYLEHKEICMPIYIDCMGNSLILKANYNIYELAKKFKLNKIPVEIVSDKQFKERSRLRTPGTKIIDSKNGDVGKVVDSINDLVYIDFNGKIKRFSIYKFLELNRWQVI